MVINLNILLVATCLLVLTRLITCNQLKLVTVLFRHGDRTAEPKGKSLCSLKPYYNETFFPIGLGQLTNEGKQREYALGQMLEKRYSSFLGDEYFPGLAESISTNTDRTKASLQLVLTGLFPPKTKNLTWNSNLIWQPIPYHHTQSETDIWLTYSYLYCPKYQKLYDRYVNFENGLKFFVKNRKLFGYLYKETGCNFKDPLQVWVVAANLKSEVEWGLPLPKWAEPIYPEQITNLLIESMQTHVGTLELKQLSGGFLLKKIISNMLAKAQNTLAPKEKKIILYSAHDIQILYMTAVLDRAIDSPIPYGSYYIFELFEKNCKNFVKIYANDFITYEMKEVNISGCGTSCQLEEFIHAVDKYILDDDNACWN